MSKEYTNTIQVAAPLKPANPNDFKVVSPDDVYGMIGENITLSQDIEDLLKKDGQLSQNVEDLFKKDGQLSQEIIQVANKNITLSQDIENLFKKDDQLAQEILQVADMIGESIYIGETPPPADSDAAVWINPADTSLNDAMNALTPDGYVYEGTYADALKNIKEKIDAVSYSLNKELEPGGFKIRTDKGEFSDITDARSENPAADSEYRSEEDKNKEDITETVFIPSAATESGEVEYETDSYIGLANVNTVRVKRGKKYNLPTLKDGELAFCKDTNELFIGNHNKDGYSITKIGSNSIGGSSSNGGNLTGEYLDLTSPNGTSYRLRITDSGLITTVPTESYKRENEEAIDPGEYQGLIINQMYGGGPAMGEIEIQPGTGIAKTSRVGYVSHSFVELYNNSSFRKDLILDGLSLQYKSTTGNWQSLPLKGVIPFRHSFLIRGLQHVPMGPDEITRLEIERYDMQWNLAFSDKGFSMYLGVGTTPLQVTNPADVFGDGKTKQEGFIDLVGVGGRKETETVTAYMDRFWHFMDNKTAALRVDNNDPYNGNLDENSNRDSVEELDYSTCNVEIFGPRCIADGEWDSYVNKLQLNPVAPSMINISFGYDGDRSRSFNWHTLLTDEGGLYYRKLGTVKWNYKESDKKNIKHHDCSSTIHSATIKNLEPGATYEYKCGYDGHFSDTYSFVMDRFAKSATPASGEKENMRILWTSDQQSWTPYEYQVWKVASEYIRENEEYDWLLNTGDISQNGMRAFEWRYYYKYATDTKYMCHEISVGNNDLGGGADKNDSTPITYYLTHDNKHPRVNGCYSFNIGCCHFFCLNSNQKDAVSHNKDGAADWKSMFKDEIAWLKEDLEANKDKRWCIGFMHLSPVTCVRGKHQQLFLEVFQEYKVHIVLCGHNHTHSRSIPLSGLPIDTNIKLTEQTPNSPFIDSSIPAEIKNPAEHYRDDEFGTVYCMCQATGYKLKGKEGQLNGAWWYDWNGPHPSEPCYEMIDINWNKIDIVAYKIKGIVPMGDDREKFLVTPPIPVGPARYNDNPIYGGTGAPEPTPIEKECIDYMSDTCHADKEYNKLFNYGRGSYNWRPWGPDGTWGK